MSTMLCDLKIPRCRVSFHRLPSKQQKGTISINTTAPNKTNNARFQGTPTCSLHNPFPARSGEKTLVHKNHKNQSVLGDPLETNIRFNRYPASANANDNCPPQPRLEELPRLVHAHMGATESVWTRHGGLFRVGLPPPRSIRSNGIRTRVWCEDLLVPRDRLAISTGIPGSAQDQAGRGGGQARPTRVSDVLRRSSTNQRF